MLALELHVVCCLLSNGRVCHYPCAVLRDTIGSQPQLCECYIVCVASPYDKSKVFSENTPRPLLSLSVLCTPHSDISLPCTPRHLTHAVVIPYLVFEVRCGGRQGFVPRQHVVPKLLLLGNADSLLGIPQRAQVIMA